MSNIPWTPNFPYTEGFNYLRFTTHALNRMKERRMSRDDVRLVMLYGEGVPARDEAIRYRCDLRTIPVLRKMGAIAAGVYDVVVILDRATCVVITAYRLDHPDRQWWKVSRRPGSDNDQPGGPRPGGRL